MAFSKKRLGPEFAHPTAHLLIVYNKVDLKPAVDIIQRHNVYYQVFGTGIFIGAENYSVTLALESDLKNGNFYYAFVFIANPVGGLVSAPHLKPKDAAFITDLLLMQPF